MQDHAKEVWPELSIPIAPCQPFHELAKQKLSDYRATMGTKAIEVVNKHMMSRRFVGRKDRKEWVEWAFNPKSFPFRYEKVEKTTDSESVAATSDDSHGKSHPTKRWGSPTSSR
ncbi:hypothetical protein C8T65DRAFT_742412 [Cerioporus squamosus]|nr:hypothetical protein C8T65DRAFT_742412 [Cerioporus squamosus]